MTSIKEIYESPETEAVLFDSDDIVTVSFDTGDDELPPAIWG